MHKARACHWGWTNFHYAALHTSKRERHPLRKSVILAALVGALALPAAATAGIVVGPQVDPIVVSGNPACDFKIDPVADGTYSFGGLIITIDVNGSTFSFTSNIPVLEVIVKGGPNGANVYTYPSPGVTSDSGLASPLNNRGGASGLSHICFSTDDKKPPPDDK